MLCSKCNQFLFLLHILRVQIPWRAGVTAEAVMHVLAAYFEWEEQVLVGGVRVNAELGKVAEETFTGVTRSVREGVFGLLEECFEFVAGEFGHELILQPILHAFM